VACALAGPGPATSRARPSNAASATGKRDTAALWQNGSLDEACGSLKRCFRIL
jgi:hypothetical protein